MGRASRQAFLDSCPTLFGVAGHHHHPLTHSEQHKLPDPRFGEDDPAQVPVHTVDGGYIQISSSACRLFFCQPRGCVSVRN